ITGGSSGIGKEIVRLLVRRGSNVTLLARRADVLTVASDEISRECPRPAQHVLTISVDVADRHALATAIAQAESQLGPCDLLVTSAGIAQPGYFADLPFEIFRRTMDV